MNLDYNKFGMQELYECAVAYVRGRGKASTSLLQRHFNIGFGKARELIERMEQDGIVTKPEGQFERRVIG